MPDKEIGKALEVVAVESCLEDDLASGVERRECLFMAVLKSLEVVTLALLRVRNLCHIFVVTLQLFQDALLVRKTEICGNGEHRVFCRRWFRADSEDKLEFPHERPLAGASGSEVAGRKDDFSAVGKFHRAYSGLFPRTPRQRALQAVCSAVERTPSEGSSCVGSLKRAELGDSELSNENVAAT